jgi:hypothetical protein
VDAEINCFVKVQLVFVHGQNDDSYGQLHLLGAMRDSKAVKPRHVQVEDSNRGRVSSDQIERRLTVFRLGQHAKARLLFDELLKTLTKDWMVVGDQNCRCEERRI